MPTRKRDDAATTRASSDDDDSAATIAIGYRRARATTTTRRDDASRAHVEALNAAFARHVARRRQRRRASFCARRVGITSRTRTRSRPSSRTRRGSEDEGKRAEARARGEVYVWGQGDSAQLGLGGDVDERRRPTRVTTGAMGEASATRIAAGGTHTLALTSDGACYSWGNNDNGALGRVVNKDADPDAEYAPGKVELPWTSRW